MTKVHEQTPVYFLKVKKIFLTEYFLSHLVSILNRSSRKFNKPRIKKSVLCLYTFHILMIHTGVFIEIEELKFKKYAFEKSGDWISNYKRCFIKWKFGFILTDCFFLYRIKEKYLFINITFQNLFIYLSF